MSNITLVMVRTPLEEVNFGKKNGRWGRMLVLRGAKVMSGRYTGAANLPDIFSTGIFGPFGTLTAYAAALAVDVFGKPMFRIGNKSVTLDTFGGDLEIVARFDTLERFRTDSNKSKYYVQLRPRPEKAYEIRMDVSKNVGNTVNDTGQCFRVIDHNTKTGGGGKAGILLHEASHPGWLTGCIAPREINNRVASNDFSTSKSAMQTLFRLMGGFSEGKKADLLVMDW